ncbi:hypothetical protein TWF696_001411 [Orbilia brochopaga]|uniref:Uncharacterized protein n=1 Tax=Orbilia brochopaga TaxID=3140254 RepID=A0AAV9U9C7_9PEZI
MPPPQKRPYDLELYELSNDLPEYEFKKLRFNSHSPNIQLLSDTDPAWDARWDASHAMDIDDCSDADNVLVSDHDYHREKISLVSNHGKATDPAAEFRLVEYMTNLILSVDGHARAIGVLELKVQHGLLEAKKLTPLLHIEGSGIPDHVFISGNRKRKTDIFEVSVNIYSPRCMADSVGQILGRSGLYLQPPDFLPDGISYYNPHFYSIQGELNPLSTLAQTQTPIQSMPINYNDVFDIEMEDQVTRGECIDAKMKDFLRTDLLEYENRVTGQRTTLLPSEQKGGIIADEMGMGKTLTVLSLIASSLEEKNIFKRTETEIDIFTMDENALKQPKGGSLVIATPSLLGGWKEEMEKHFWPNSIKFEIFHGGERNIDELALSEADIVITTYNTLSAEWFKKKSALHKVIWYRIVLDEAHMIRNPKTIQFRAVSALAAESRWCISGTPIQNSLNDLQSLVSFLQAPSQDNHRYFFRDFITAPLKRGDYLGVENLRRLIRSICLRRRNHALNLPELVEETCNVELSSHERERYNVMKEETLKEIDAALKGSSCGTVYLKILQLIMKQRTLCNIGTNLLEFESDTSDESGSVPEDMKADCAECQCNIGVLDTNSAAFTVCGHWICSDCLPNYILSIGKGKGRTCSICGEKLPAKFRANTQKSRKSAPTKKRLTPLYHDTAPSSKFQALISQLSGLPGKSLVFSVWTTTLDLLEPILKNNRIGYFRVDGSTKPSNRGKILSSFRTDDKIKVLLMTFGVGAVGLNLTVASTAHLIEPQWNPMIEKQAIGRIHRLGQEKPVKVIRYIVKDSIEEDILNRQRKKLQIAEMHMADESPHENGIREKLKELRALF